MTTLVTPIAGSSAFSLAAIVAGHAFHIKLNFHDDRVPENRLFSFHLILSLCITDLDIITVPAIIMT
ncbi:hypothetical protein SDC9_49410 [bioreactor metagenome]|uniref:Uncharacterized protein n=1 Tax=bioreactor metagenome TaxID=1076179 RepID=A0A644WHS3_9ZZZZ